MITTEKQMALAENYEAFEKMLPTLLQQSPGKYALLRHRQLIGTFDSASAAHSAGTSSFDDGLFSVQKIKEGTVSLGFFSYARYCRVA